MIFFTLGGPHYDKMLKKHPNLSKAIGGWALDLHSAKKFQKLLKTTSIFGLKIDEYGIYELPECKPHMVISERLLEHTVIGRRIG